MLCNPFRIFPSPCKQKGDEKAYQKDKNICDEKMMP